MISNDQLLARAKALDPTALQILHERFYEPVARFIQFKVGDPRTVEDLSGEVFVRVLEGLRKGHSWRDSPKAWIIGIARHVVTDYYRKRERMTEVQLNERLTATEGHDPAHQAILGERKQRLMQAIQQLSDNQREVILLRFIEGLDIKAVAAVINKTPGAVKLLQYRATRALADIMRDMPVESR